MFHISHIPRHMPAFFEGLPIFQSGAPYILPSWAGMALWATTPAFLYAFFAGVKKKVVIRAMLSLLAITLGIIVLSNGQFDGAAGGLPIPFDLDPPLGLQYYPFVLLIAYALYAGVRSGNRLVVASWSAIVPIALLHFSFFTPPPSFGYQYALDYYPFLLLLTWASIGDRMRWHHMVLIALAIVINLWGALWIHQFSANGFLGLAWVRF